MHNDMEGAQQERCIVTKRLKLHAIVKMLTSTISAGLEEPGRSVLGSTYYDSLMQCSSLK